MEDNFKILGRRVKFLRMEKGISQTKMAELLGLSQTNLSNMESGRTAITTQNLFKMRELLQCTMADFFVDFDGEMEQASQIEEGVASKNAIELEDAVQILKLLKNVEIKGI